MQHSSDLSPSPLSLSVWFQVKLEPSTLDLWGAWLSDAWADRDARAQLWGRVCGGTDFPLTKGEIQLKHISVLAVEYHSFELTGNIFSTALKAASINSLKTAGEQGLGGSHRKALCLNFASTYLWSSIFICWYIHYFQSFSRGLSNGQQIWHMNAGPSQEQPLRVPCRESNKRQIAGPRWSHWRQGTLLRTVYK